MGNVKRLHLNGIRQQVKEEPNVNKELQRYLKVKNRKEFNKTGSNKTNDIKPPSMMTDIQDQNKMYKTLNELFPDMENEGDELEVI